jgi:hypothetical protein
MIYVQSYNYLLFCSVVNETLIEDNIYSNISDTLTSLSKNFTFFQRNVNSFTLIWKQREGEREREGEGERERENWIRFWFWNKWKEVQVKLYCG